MAGRPQIIATSGASSQPAHNPENACPGLDPGWYRFSEKIMRKQKDSSGYY
jgi:hypothetical protein